MIATKASHNRLQRVEADARPSCVRSGWLSLCAFALSGALASVADADLSAVEDLKADQPIPVAALIDRIVDCNHWRGEEPYDAERAKEIEAAISSLRCKDLAA